MEAWAEGRTSFLVIYGELALVKRNQRPIRTKGQRPAENILPPDSYRKARQAGRQAGSQSRSSQLNELDETATPSRVGLPPPGQGKAWQRAGGTRVASRAGIAGKRTRKHVRLSTCAAWSPHEG